MEVSGGLPSKFLLELGEPVVELAIVAATGLHQLADELDAAGAFGIGELAMPSSSCCFAGGIP